MSLRAPAQRFLVVLVATVLAVPALWCDALAARFLSTVADVYVDGTPLFLAFHPGRRLVYVSDAPVGAYVSVVDVDNHTVVGAIHVSNNPKQMAMDAPHDRLYVPTGDRLDVIDCSSNTVIDSRIFPLAGFGATASGVDASAGILYVAGTAPNGFQILAIALSSGLLLEHWPLSEQARRIVVDERVHRVYIASDNAITMYDGNSQTVMGTIPFSGASIDDMALDTQRDRMYAIGRLSAKIYVIDLNTAAVVTEAPCDFPFPVAVGVNVALNHVYTVEVNRWIQAYDATLQYSGGVTGSSPREDIEVDSANGLLFVAVDRSLRILQDDQATEAMPTTWGRLKSRFRGGD